MDCTFNIFEDYIFDIRFRNERQQYIHAKYERKEFTIKPSDESTVFLCWEDEPKWFGFVEASNKETLVTLRDQIKTQGVQTDVANYQFLYRRAPVTAIQEQKKQIFECLAEVDGNPTILLRKSVVVRSPVKS
jgi:hypothetical protein